MSRLVGVRSGLPVAGPTRKSRLYEVALREGGPADLERYLDGALLVDAWRDLVLPRGLRSAWQGVIDRVGASPADASERVGAAR
jgi:hypothetical protein